MLHICPRLPHQPFVEPPFEEEILAFLWFFGRNRVIRKLTDVNINKLHQPWRSFAAIINKCLTEKISGYDSLRLCLPELTNEYIKNSNVYQEYYAVATGVTPPNPKASVRKTRRSFDTNITPPTATAGPRLTTSEKGKQAAKASNAKSLSALSKGVCWGRWWRRVVGSSGLWWNGREKTWSGVADTDDEGNGEEDLGLNAVQVAIQLQSKRLCEESQKENDEFLKTIDENMQKIIKNQVKEKVKVQVSKILLKIEQTVNELLGAEVLTRSSNSSKTSYAIAADLSEMELKKNLIEKMEGNKSIHRSNKQRNLYKATVEAYESDKIILDTYGDTITLKRRRDDDADKEEEPSTGPDRGESATAEEPMQTTFEMEEPAHPEFGTGADDQPIVESSQHPEWFSQQHKPPTPDLDFSNIIINRIKVDTLTPKLLAGPTYELLKGSCKSLVELEYQLEEVYKATTNQLDWVNPEGQQYPHNLLKPLPLILNNRGRHVIPFDHFIINDLEYLRGDKHALWGVSHWGHKHQQFYGFAINQESTRDVYSKRSIIAVTELKIVEWHNYKHLDWITVRRDDDKLYKFKEGDFKRLRIQDIEDMFLLLVQGKQTNLTKKLNLTKPDTYRSDLKRKEAYIAYSNPRGFIYQNKDTKNKLMRIDESHKFSDGTLIDVCTTLDDRLKGIRM
nr:hypothetical protein [Tanacetum cinerariifolium]